MAQTQKRPKKDDAAPSETGAQESPPATPTPEPSPPSNGDRKPIKVLTYQVNHDTYVQVLIRDRQAQRKDGKPFTTYEVSVRKRYVDQRDGEFKSSYSFAPSELYAVVHALTAAAGVVAELRAADVPY